MSSDESTSTQLSVVSSQASVSLKDKLKQHTATHWEIRLIGNFILSLYHRTLISPKDNFLCKKWVVRQEFEKFASLEQRKRFKDLNGTDMIGTLLHRCGFLLNTARGSKFYQLNSKDLFDFRNEEIKSRDKIRIREDVFSNYAGTVLGNETEQMKFNAFEVNLEIDENSPEHKLVYQGTTMQQRRENYFPTNMSCCICQMDFSSMDSFEDHIHIHNDEKDFEYLKELSQFDTPIFNMSYRLCKNSHYFCFNLNTYTENVIIEKIIIVQSRSLFYVHDMRVPYEIPANGCDKFYVDSHLFALFVEQPVVVISHLKDARNTRIIEEHHFSVSVLPKVNFAIKPYRLPNKKQFKVSSKLLDYFPPIEIRNALRDDFVHEKLMQISNEFRDYVRNEKILQPQTIGPTLTTLLHVEDMDTIKEYLNLVQHNVTLRNLGDSYSFRIRPKQRIFVENILSTFDDIILTTRKNETTDSESLINLILELGMTGRIEDVNSGRIVFRSFNKLDIKRTYTVIFRPSRLTLRYQYRSLEMLPIVMPYLKKFLFPGPLASKEPSTISIEIFNKSILSNPEQLQAVRNIAEGPRNDATYIIFGPPGTGKTTTLVESILQVVKRNDTRVLVTASSNSACDELALRLCKSLNTGGFDMPRSIVRIYAQSNESRIDTIDDLLIEHSNMYNYEHFYPDIEILHEYRIVVCTMTVVAKLATGKFGRRENGSTLYTHLFIDEVAAATEVEALMPISSVLTPKSCLIIAGDHKQLGPILKSKRAEELNLGQSLMERLLKRECYRVNTDTGDYDRSIQTRLRINFRSHPEIVNLFSAMYYNHDLEPRAKIEDVSWIKEWHAAPNKEYPIIFYCVNGKTKSDNNSYSLYNSEEINIVMDYVKDLMYFGINGKPVSESDIGIISPYKKQHLRIREELAMRKWYSIETGSVENFQGREKNIIIASFVRSDTSTLGFLESPNRLNVTLSRAKSLLILVGNASTLSINPDFAHIIKECRRHQSLVGEIFTGLTAQSLEYSQGSESVLDMVNRCMKEFTLNSNSEKVNRHQGTSSRRRYGRNTSNNKENLNAKGESQKTSDNENIKDFEKPSTSKVATMTAKEKQAKSNSTGKVTRTYRSGTKQSQTTSNATTTQKKNPVNLESYFNELPNVPTTTTAKNAAMKQASKPSNVQQMQMPPHPQMNQIPQVQQPPYYPVHLPPAMATQYEPSNQSILGMPLIAQYQMHQLHNQNMNQQHYQFQQQMQMKQQLEQQRQFQLKQQLEQQTRFQQQMQQNRQRGLQQEKQQQQKLQVQEKQKQQPQPQPGKKKQHSLEMQPSISSNKPKEEKVVPKQQAPIESAKQKQKQTPQGGEQRQAGKKIHHSLEFKPSNTVKENKVTSMPKQEKSLEIGKIPDEVCNKTAKLNQQKLQVQQQKQPAHGEQNKQEKAAVSSYKAKDEKPTVMDWLKLQPPLASAKLPDDVYNKSAKLNLLKNSQQQENCQAKRKNKEEGETNGHKEPQSSASKNISQSTEGKIQQVVSGENSRSAKDDQTSLQNQMPAVCLKSTETTSKKSSMATALPHLVGAFNRPSTLEKNTKQLSENHSSPTATKATSTISNLSSKCNSSNNTTSLGNLKIPIRALNTTTETKGLYPKVTQSIPTSISTNPIYNRPASKEALYPTISQAKPMQSNYSSNSVRLSTTASTSSYTSSSLNQSSATENIYSSYSGIHTPPTSTLRSTSYTSDYNINHTTSDSNRTRYNLSNGRTTSSIYNNNDEAVDALNSYHFSRPVRNLNFDSEKAGKSHKRSNDKSESKCTIA